MASDCSQIPETSQPSSTTSTDNGPVVCVFCASSPGTSPQHLASATALAHAFADHNIRLVYGGGTHGMMGEVARTLVSRRGPNSVLGIIPKALLDYEHGDAINSIEQKEYGGLLVVEDMHTRKEKMAHEVMKGGPGSGFVALSGGFGTLEEVMEMTTWNQLGILESPIVLFNVESYYDGIIQWIRTAVHAGFIRPANERIVVEALDAEEVVKQLQEYQPSKERLNLDWTKK